MRAVKIVLFIISTMMLLLFEAIDFTGWLRKGGNADVNHIHAIYSKTESVASQKGEDTDLQTTPWFDCDCPAPIEDQNLGLLEMEDDPESDSGVVVYYTPSDWYLHSQDILREIQVGRLPGKRLGDY